MEKSTRNILSFFVMFTASMILIFCCPSCTYASDNMPPEAYADPVLVDTLYQAVLSYNVNFDIARDPGLTRDQWIATVNRIPDLNPELRNLAGYIYDTCQSYGLDYIFALARYIPEGSNGYAPNYNLNGDGRVYSCFEACIQSDCYLMSQVYLKPEGAYYSGGTTLFDISKRYCHNHPTSASGRPCACEFNQQGQLIKLNCPPDYTWASGIAWNYARILSYVPTLTEQPLVFDFLKLRLEDFEPSSNEVIQLAPVTLLEQPEPLVQIMDNMDPTIEDAVPIGVEPDPVRVYKHEPLKPIPEIAIPVIIPEPKELEVQLKNSLLEKVAQPPLTLTYAYRTRKEEEFFNTIKLLVCMFIMVFWKKLVPQYNTFCITRNSDIIYTIYLHRRKNGARRETKRTSQRQQEA